MKEHFIVKNFLVETARLQSREKMVDLFKLGQGVMPASFLVHYRDPTQKTSLLADFGETAIGRVAPVDSGLLWIILLRAYTRWTGDNSLAESPNCERAMHLILRLYLSEDTSPSWLFANGWYMIDRRMGIYGCPIEIQDLFFMAMRRALSMSKQAYEIPLKICYPAMDNHEWQTFTGCDPKNTWRSYHNGGSWPVLVAVSGKLGSLNLARRVMELDWLGPALHYDQVFMRDFIPSALAFLMKGEHFTVKNFLVETARLQSREKMVDLFKLGQGVTPASYKVHHSNPTQKTPKSLAGRVATVLNSWWSQCIGNTDRLWFQSALCGLLYLGLRFGVDYSSTLLFTDCCSVPDMFGLPAWLVAATFPDIDPVQLEENYNDRSGFGNTAVIILDELHMFVPSYITGIGRLRWWCETYGWRVDLSPVFNKKIIVFSTAPGGAFEFKIVHNNRAITISLYGRDLYAMGFRNPRGTFEFKARSEQRQNFMSGQNVHILPFKKNYRFITPQDGVGNIRLGWLSLKEAFEVLHKCQGETPAVREAVATFAVHISEAGRIQSTLKDACHISLAQTVETVDRRSDNTMWICDYGTYGRQETHRIDSMISGERPPEITSPEDQVVTEVQILNNIRIFPRGTYNEGNFELESAPSEPTESDPVLNKAYHDWLKGKNKKLSRSRWGSKQETGLKICHYEGIPSSSTYPPYLVEDWCLEEEEGEEKGGGKGGNGGVEEEEGEEKGGGKGGNGGVEEEEGEEKGGGKGGNGGGDRGGKGGGGDGGGNNVVEMSDFKDTQRPFEDFLSHFPSVRRMIDCKTKALNQLNTSSTETYSPINHVAFPIIKEKLGAEESLFKFPVMKVELGAIGRKMLQTRTLAIQPNHLIRAARVISRAVRFAL